MFFNHFLKFNILIKNNFNFTNIYDSSNKFFLFKNLKKKIKNIKKFKILSKKKLTNVFTKLYFKFNSIKTIFQFKNSLGFYNNLFFFSLIFYNRGLFRILFFDLFENIHIVSDILLCFFVN